MDKDDAGLCANGQRRYLWTDAFGVLNFVSLASLSKDEDKRRGFLDAAITLVEVVHESLGRPRSEEFPMLKDEESPSGYAGLRIGKNRARTKSDAGMSLDGMYFHYVDKWLFALLRLGQESGDLKFIRQAAKFVKCLNPLFVDPTSGAIRWKINMDGSPIQGIEQTRVNDDTLNAYIIYTLIDNELHDSPLAAERKGLRQALRGYNPRSTYDPLGWGLEAWMGQWLPTKHRNQRNSELRQLAPYALNEAHLELPFRLFGALIGCRIFGAGRTSVAKEEAGIKINDELFGGLLKASIEHEGGISKQDESHAAINRVMLASVLLAPAAFERRPDEQPVSF
eukprot:CAMPEP_0174260792 /NCGR_PEP_ID=MMETSP0439-20130205/10537_1 /TAXON_ID=0 /ORGANISM="Stereomyxa ramosa, Strain Chinc5" /LENGTH=337 /DNA_ID=CAMNT_0015345121 /DNA_START=221 /DNA_END=1234 /DNA_ORIENTATION=+